MLLKLLAESLGNRKGNATIAVFAVALATFLLLSVEMLRTAAKESFAASVSGVDLIVGARAGQLQLLLYAIFRIGSPIANVSWESYAAISGHGGVAWSVPIMLGDSHRGYPVVGTTSDYFQLYSYGAQRPLEFAAGGPFTDNRSVVLGAVAAEAGYGLGTEIVLAHGTGPVSFLQHSQHPFRVSGILRHTGTPVDRALHVSLEAMQQLHANGFTARRSLGPGQQAEHPAAISAFLLGLHDRSQALGLQRAINSYPQEPLQAILPLVALSGLWNLLKVAESAFMVAALLAVVAGILGMMMGILASLEARRREMALLRVIGARPRHIATLLVSEAMVLGTLGALLGLAAAYGMAILGWPTLLERYGLRLPISLPGVRELAFLGVVLGCSLLAGLLPAWRAYRNSLIDGLTPRL